MNEKTRQRLWHTLFAFIVGFGPCLCQNVVVFFLAGRTLKQSFGQSQESTMYFKVNLAPKFPGLLT